MTSLKLILFYFLLLFYTASCNSFKTLPISKISGKYFWNGIYGVGSKIELKEDSTFIYEWYAGLSSGVTTGKYVINKNNIILNSKYQPNTEYSPEILELDSFSSNYLTLEVIDHNNEPLAFAKWIMKNDSIDKVYGVLDIDGKAKIEKPLKNELYISFVSIEPISIEVSPEFSKIKIKTIESFNFYEFFTDEKWNWKNGKLYNSKIKKDRFVKKPYYERKVSLND